MNQRSVLSRRRLLLSVLAGALLTGCGGPGPVYPGPETLPLLDGSRTRSITPENPTGEPGQGGRTHPDSTLDSRATNARAADSLGQGWKVRPFIAVQAGETVTLMDADGPGTIRHIWMVEGLSRDHVLRFYWDGEQAPRWRFRHPTFSP
ncbi:MAG: hypothetical protein ACLR1G_15710 [Alistipes indistinctus]